VIKRRCAPATKPAARRKPRVGLPNAGGGARRVASFALVWRPCPASRGRARREPPVSQCSPTYSLSSLTGIEPVGRQFSSVQLGLSSCVFGPLQFATRAFRAVQVADVLPRCCPASRKPPASTLSGVNELKGRWDRCPPSVSGRRYSPGRSKLILARSDAVGPQIHLG